MTQIAQLLSRNLVKKGSDHVHAELFHNQRPYSSFLSSGSIVLRMGTGLHTAPPSAFLLGISAES